MGWITFEQPGFLVLLTLLIPVVWMAWSSRRFDTPLRWFITLCLRSITVVCLTLSLAEPSFARPTRAVQTTIVLDRSLSIPNPLLAASRGFADRLLASKKVEDDQAAVVTVARDARIAVTPTTSPAGAGDDHAGPRDGTDLAAGVRNAVAMTSADCAHRIILISDGNDTEGQLMREAELAASHGIPIDVVPLEYALESEVVFDGVRTPAIARVGQTLELRMLLVSQGESSGRIFLKHSGRRVDLDADAPGDGLAVALSPGPNTVTVSVPIDAAGAHRFEALFEPDGAQDDSILENNRALAVTFVEGGGQVLVVDSSGGEETQALVSALRASSVDCMVVAPDRLVGEAAFLSGFDAIVLANVPRWQIDGETDRILRSFVHDLGGGLLMIGGPESLGAGGWIGSAVADTLPVLLDPPATRDLLRASVAIVIDRSGSMASPAMSAFATKLAMASEAAIAGVEAMSRLDEVCVIAFDGSPSLEIPRQTVGAEGGIARRLRLIQAGGGTELYPAMEAALSELRASSAGSKHMLVITDGMTVGGPEIGLALAERSKALGITISTVGIEEGAKDPTLKQIADVGGGRFHAVTDVTSARELPRFFIRETSLHGRRLTLEGNFAPSTLPSTSGPLRGIAGVPSIKGYVVTPPRPGLAQNAVVVVNSEGVDPVYSYWNHGLGRAITFSSDAGLRWTAGWRSWAEHRAFWEQTVRWLLRPASPTNASVRTRLEGDLAIVDLELLSENGGFDTRRNPSAAVISPDGNARSSRVEQVGPGRWQTTFPADREGTYLTVFDCGADEAGRRLAVRAAVNAPFPAELRTTRHNRALLERVAERTGGRVLELDTPTEAIDAFARDGLSRPMRMKGLWDLLAVIAAILFVLDAASRRLLFDWTAAGERLRDARGRLRADGASITALRRARDARKESTESARDGLGTSDHASARGSTTTGSLPGAVVGEHTRPRPADVPRDPPPLGEKNAYGEGADPDATVAERLLRAKRRAQRDFEE